MRISDWSSYVCSSDLRRLLPCRVAIETENRNLGHLPQPFDLVLRQCGTQWRHRLIAPRLCESDDIHITFDHDHAPSPSRRGGGAIEIIEGAPLLEKRRHRKVPNFGPPPPQHPTPKK